MQDELSSDDLQILSEYASKHAGAIEHDAREFSAAADEIVANSVGLNAMQITGLFEAAMANRDRSATARYQAVLELLSSEGRKTVERYMLEDVNPIMYLQMPTALARSDAQRFMSAIEERRTQLQSSLATRQDDAASDSGK